MDRYWKTVPFISELSNSRDSQSLTATPSLSRQSSSNTAFRTMSSSSHSFSPTLVHTQSTTNSLEKEPDDFAAIANTLMSPLPESRLNAIESRPASRLDTPTRHSVPLVAAGPETTKRKAKDHVSKTASTTDCVTTDSKPKKRSRKQNAKGPETGAAKSQTDDEALPLRQYLDKEKPKVSTTLGKLNTQKSVTQKQPRKPKPKPALSTGALSTGMLQTTLETRSSEQMALSSAQDSRQNNTRVEYSTTHFDPVTGNKLMTTTQVNEQSSQEINQNIALLWQRMEITRQNQIAIVKSATPQVAMASSGTFQFYLREVCFELAQLARARAAFLQHLRDTKQPERNWREEPQFILRFCYGINMQQVTSGEPRWLFSENGVKSASGEYPPWLACLWTLPEMLRHCMTTMFVDACMEDPSHARYYQKFLKRQSQSEALPPRAGITSPDYYFIISPLVMTGYCSGQLLHTHIPGLHDLMTDDCKNEQSKKYFPWFSSYDGGQSRGFELKLEYDFYTVHLETPDSHVPEKRAMYCTQAGTCYFIEPGHECDGLLLQLINDQQMRARCFSIFEKTALRCPHIDPDDQTFSEVVDFAQLRESVTQPSSFGEHLDENDMYREKVWEPKHTSLLK